MKELTILHHLGLGDIILISGLIVHVSKDYDRVYIGCRKKDFNSVRSFFLLQPKIQIQAIDTDSTTPDLIFEPRENVLPLGFYSPLGMNREISFAENFYRHAGVRYDMRWDRCPIQEVVDAFYYMEPPTPFNFSHDDGARGFNIKIHPRSWDVFGLNRGSSILSYASYMRAADRVDLIDGPFLHLAESIELRGDLFYHKYARPIGARWNDVDCPTRKKWTVLT